MFSSFRIQCNIKVDHLVWSTGMLKRELLGVEYVVTEAGDHSV